MCVGFVLPAHSDPGPTKLFDGDEGLLEVCVFREDVRSEVEGKVFGNENVV